MKKHILIGTSMLLTLGTAVAGSFVYGRAADSTLKTYEPAMSRIAQEPTPTTIAMWKTTAASADYTAPKAPI